MKSLKNIPSSLLFLLITIGFYQCASTQKLENKLPLEIGEVYSQHWVSGVRGGGSGYNVFIPIKSNPSKIVLDSLYFKGKRVKLESKSASVFVGRFKSEANQRQDIIMSSDPLAEYGNSVPKISKKMPFELNDTECIISYQKGNKTLYYKISNITKKASTEYPIAPSNR
ncbi:hypothetical protein Q4Q39_18030 [Flavivirga amylovorans]|uniref:Lipoprotein n=1 Tax=Flavivirga amylovorans TaxID=870486 RepID=A0ABT8X650_9FLAO|nr:hypothetical protein [Flavivirga amylovorans]MDO5989307.1 hypothetical protein [Flavivirga amylovorans]